MAIIHCTGPSVDIAQATSAKANEQRRSTGRSAGATSMFQTGNKGLRGAREPRKRSGKDEENKPTLLVSRTSGDAGRQDRLDPSDGNGHFTGNKNRALESADQRRPGLQQHRSRSLSAMHYNQDPSDGDGNFTGKSKKTLASADQRRPNLQQHRSKSFSARHNIDGLFVEDRPNKKAAIAEKWKKAVMAAKLTNGKNASKQHKHQRAKPFGSTSKGGAAAVQDEAATLPAVEEETAAADGLLSPTSSANASLVESSHSLTDPCPYTESDPAPSQIPKKTPAVDPRYRRETALTDASLYTESDPARSQILKRAADPRYRRESTLINASQCAPYDPTSSQIPKRAADPRYRRESTFIHDSNYTSLGPSSSKTPKGSIDPRYRRESTLTDASHNASSMRGKLSDCPMPTKLDRERPLQTRKSASAHIMRSPDQMRYQNAERELRLRQIEAIEGNIASSGCGDISHMERKFRGENDSKVQFADGVTKQRRSRRTSRSEAPTKSSRKHESQLRKSLRAGSSFEDSRQRRSPPTLEELGQRAKYSDATTVEADELQLSANAEQERHTHRTNELLFDVFPKHVAEALRDGQKVEPESREVVTVFFSDIVGFTEISSTLSPMKISNMLDRLYNGFDSLSRKHDVFKVETIGDAYMAVTNLHTDQPDHAKRIAEFAMDAVKAANATSIDTDDPTKGCVNIRVGFHSGPVVANVVGSRNPRYCLFGDTVNIASRMESNSKKNRINCSERAAKFLKRQCPELPIKYRGRINVKGKGEMRAFWVNEEPRTRRREPGDSSKTASSSSNGSSNAASSQLIREKNVKSCVTKEPLPELDAVTEDEK